MKHKLLTVTFLFLFTLGLTSCESEREKHYERPSSLEGTLYNQLKASGRYTEYLKCLDLTGYGEIFKRGGSYTVFAPTDEAFARFYAEGSYEKLTDIPPTYLKEMVEFLTLNYSYSKSLLLEWSSFELNWLKDSRAFKKRSILKRYTQDGEYLVAGERKYIPLFSNEYFNFRNGFIAGVTYDESVYKYFYPNIIWKGMNLDQATFVELEVPAENGFFYGIDRVLLPLDNLSETLKNDERFSRFSEFVELFAKYTENIAETNILGNGSKVYKKTYSLISNLSTEEMMSSDHSAFNMYAVAAPDDQTLNGYITSTLLSKGYTSIDDIPLVTLRYLVNSHLKIAGANASYYPVDLKLERSPFSKLDYGNPNDVFYAKYTSNGPLYGVKHVLESPVLTSVARDIFITPDYSIFLNAMEKSGNLSLMGVDSYSVVAVNNSVFEAQGYTYNEKEDVFLHKDASIPGSEFTPVELNDLRELINNHIYMNACNASHEGGMYGKSLAGNYLAFRDDKIQGIDAVGAELGITLNNKVEGSNGFLYRADDFVPVLTQPTLAKRLTTADFSEFLTLMTQSGYGLSQIIQDATANEHIMLVPSNSAIINAKNAGKLPSSATFSVAEKESVKRFIRNHIIPVDLLFTTAPFQTKLPNTMQGESISLTNVGATGITVVKGGVTTSTVADYSKVNILAAGNWVVHTIEDVLID